MQNASGGQKLTMRDIIFGGPQTMSHIIDSCQLTKLAGGSFKLHSVDDYAVAWLTNYGGPQRIHTTTTVAN